MLRIALFIFVAAALSVATRMAWNALHLRSPGTPLVSVPIDVPALGPGEACRIDLSNIEPDDGIHLGFSLEARGLRRGSEDWQAGRMRWQWVRDGRVIEEISLASVDGDQSANEHSVVLAAGPEGASGRLHIENLGLSGTCRLLHLEAFSANRSDVAFAALLGISCGWLVWAAALAGPLQRPTSWLAALLWMTCACQMVLPGPWPFVRPLAADPRFDPVLATDAVPAPSSFQATETRPGETAPPNFLLRWKLELQPLRPLLHGLLFFAPAIVLLVLATTPARAVAMAAVLAGMVEFAQWAFGYGFDWMDVLDLVSDALGIGLAVGAFRYWHRRRGTPAQG